MTLDIFCASVFVALLALAAIGSFFLPHKPLSEKDEHDFKDAGEW